MIDLDFYDIDRRGIIAAFLAELHRGLQAERRMSCLVRARIGTDQLDFRISYVGPSRRMRRPLDDGQSKEQEVTSSVKPPPPLEIAQIDALARQYADAQTALDTLTNDLRQQIDQVVRKAWPDLRRATTRAAERYEALHAMVSDSRDLFEKPKTKILHGVRVGYRKAKDTVQVLNADNTVALIEKLLPEQQDVLISTAKKPVMSALEQLEDAQLKLIGCKRVPGDDEPIAAMAETELDKVVQALMKGAIEKAEADA